MVARLIDGKAFAETLRTRVAAAAGRLKAEHGVVPGLATVLAGEDPASQVYVRSKHKAATEAGFRSFEHRPGAGISEPALLGLVRELNADPEVETRTGACIRASGCEAQFYDEWPRSLAKRSWSGPAPMG